MNHRPFEDWLLDDEPLTPEQKHELQAHLRTCTSCTAIAESNLSLHATRLVAPAAGFPERFKVRLVEGRKWSRVRQSIGVLVFLMGGLAIFYWLAGPSLKNAIGSPAEWISSATGYIVFLLTSAQALSEAGQVFLRVLPDFVSPLELFILITVLSALGLASALSVRQLTHPPQGEFEL